MKYELINQPNNKYSAKQQIFINRGIKEEDLVHYMSLTDNDINPPEIFGDVIKEAAMTFIKIINRTDSQICVVVDSDCDGYTSAALIINYIYDIASDLIESRLHYFHHEGKQHGLQDCMDWIEDCNADLVIVPDGGRITA